MKHNISFLFLRGLGRNQYHWNNRELYEEILSNKVFFLDLPGFGLSPNSRSPRQVRNITGILRHQRDILDNFNSSSKKIIVGLSLGGIVSLDWAARYPKDWDGLVVINSSLSNLSKPWERLKPKNYKSLLKYLRLKKAKDIENLIYEMTCNTDDHKDELVNYWAKLRNNYPVRQSNVVNQLIAAMTFNSPSKNKFRMPGLVLASPKDKFVSYKCSEKIAKKYNFEIKYSDKSGHDMSVDDGDWMLQQIKCFSDKI